MKGISAQYLINWPNVNPGLVSFSFQSDIAPGNFVFTFKWLFNPASGKYQWNGWAQLPSGEVRQFGCIPGAVDWVDFTDFGIYIDSTLTFIDQFSLVGNTTLYLIVWGVD
jgi:hypothetical protein